MRMFYNDLSVFKILLTILLAFAVGIFGWLLFTYKNPVVYRYSDSDAVEYSGFVILNPFRDREPELRAEAILSKLQAKDCENALTEAGLNANRREYLCLREAWYPLVSWSLMNRLDEPNKVVLTYGGVRGEMTDVGLSQETHYSPPVEISVEFIDDKWRVTSYETYY